MLKKNLDDKLAITCITITTKQKRWLMAKGIKLAKLVRIFLQKIIDEKLDTTVREILKEAWGLK